MLTGGGTSTLQKVGSTTLNGGNTFLVVTPGTKADALSFASLTRSNNATLALTGTSLGSAPGSGVATVLSTAAPTLVGGGGAAGSTTISIVPWATGNTGANTVGDTSFVTYNSTAGFRPLATVEYATSLTTGSTNNVLLTVKGTIPSGGATVNSLLITKTGTGLVSTSGSMLTITSGAFMYSPASYVSGTETANLNFGGAEGVITSTVNADTSGDGFLTLSGVLAGTGGLTLNPINGGYIVLGGANTYTGTTTLLAGVTEFSGTVANDGTTAGAFGLSKSDIVLNPGAAGLTVYATAASTINRNLAVTGSGSVDFGTTGNFILTVNGNINLKNTANSLILDGGDTVASAMQLTGTISGAGSITDNSTYTPFTFLSGNNTYTGGTNIQQGTYLAGSDTAFGTGTISTNYVAVTSGSTTTYIAGTIEGSSTLPRTIGNAFLFGNGTLAAFTFGGTAPLNLTGGINLNGATAISFSNTAGTTFSGVVSNGALVKSGAGTLTLADANTYTGGTVISAGSVLVTNASGSGTGTGTGGVFVNASGTLLGGTGAVAGPVSVVAGGILEGGSGGTTGALTLGSMVTLSSGAVIELGLATNGTHSALASTSSNPWSIPSGQKFTFTGTPTNGVGYPDIITGLAADPGNESTWAATNAGFTTIFTYDGMGDINLNVMPVPEPATLLGGVLTAGLLAQGLRRRVQLRTKRSISC